MSKYIVASLTVALALPAASAQAQPKPPVAQFWMDVATSNMSIPGMDDMDSGAGGMMGGFFGGTKMGGGAPGQWLDTALYTRLKPSGAEGTHAIHQAPAQRIRCAPRISQARGWSRTRNVPILRSESDRALGWQTHSNAKPASKPPGGFRASPRTRPQWRF